jgi:hypothetical protein
MHTVSIVARNLYDANQTDEEKTPENQPKKINKFSSNTEK